MPRLYLPDNNNRPIGKRRKKSFFLVFLAKSNRRRITKKFKTLVVLCLRYEKYQISLWLLQFQHSMPSSSVVCFKLLELMEKLNIAQFATNFSLVPMEKFHLKILFEDSRETFLAADATKVTKFEKWKSFVHSSWRPCHGVCAKRNIKEKEKKMENNRRAGFAERWRGKLIKVLKRKGIFEFYGNQFALNFFFGEFFHSFWVVFGNSFGNVGSFRERVIIAPNLCLSENLEFSKAIATCCRYPFQTLLFP